MQRTVAIATIVAAVIAVLTYFGIRAANDAGSAAAPASAQTAGTPQTLADSMISESKDSEFDLVQAYRVANRINNLAERDIALKQVASTAMHRGATSIGVAAASAIDNLVEHDDQLELIMRYALFRHDAVRARLAVDAINNLSRRDDASRAILAFLRVGKARAVVP
jgi:hypothetical protein